MNSQKPQKARQEALALQALRQALRERGEKVSHYAPRDLRKAARELVKRNRVYMLGKTLVIAKRAKKHP